KAPNINQMAEESVSISAPDIDLDGALSQGAGENGGDASFDGAVTAQGEVTGNNVKLSGHGHDGVEPGNGQSGKPVNI
ncbi:MAG: translation initiation factor IF-2, partial [Citrobacter portucalensis]